MARRIRRIRFVFAIAAPLLALAACDTGSPVGAHGNARLTVQLTDAPGDLEEAWVKVQKVELVGAAEQTTTTTTGTEEQAPSTDLTVSEDWIDLLTLQEGATEPLFTGDVPAGSYSQVRLYVCDMYIKTTDGQIIATPGAELPSGVTADQGTELKLTSQCKSGFKVLLRGDMKLTPDNASTLTIDFDAKKSFAHQAGNSGKWIVTPVLFGNVANGSGSTGTGSIEGTVALALPTGTTLPTCPGAAAALTESDVLSKFVPTAKLATETAAHTGTTTAPATAGNPFTYKIGNLADGTYTLGFDPVVVGSNTLTYTAAATPATAAVTAATKGSANYSITAVACAATTP